MFCYRAIGRRQSKHERVGGAFRLIAGNRVVVQLLKYNSAAAAVRDDRLTGGGYILSLHLRCTRVCVMVMRCIYLFIMDKLKPRFARFQLECPVLIALRALSGAYA